MLLTCLKCGHQTQVANGPGGASLSCVCGVDYVTPGVLHTGNHPSEKAADRSRQKAFRAAGVVKNVGGYALGVAALGLPLFPLGLVGAIMGAYVLIALRGPLAKYSGRQAAVAAIFLGSAVFTIEGSMFLDKLEERRLAGMEEAQKGAVADLKRLRRAQVLYRATRDTYTGFDNLRFKRASGEYTLYLTAEDHLEGADGDDPIVVPLPSGFNPATSADGFTAVAVANLDGDEFVDVWIMTDYASPQQVRNDVDDTEREPVWPDRAP